VSGGAAAQTTGRAVLRALGVLFVATGLVGLVAEQIFEKLLSTVVGASTPAGAIVLAVYFLGLTLGGLLYGAVSASLRRPLLLYALLEGLVGLWALALCLGFGIFQSFSSAIVAAAGATPLAVAAARALVSALLILPPTVAMGMTFPAIVGVVRQASARFHTLISAFYALNLLGALLGTLLAPYLLFPRLGLTGTLAGLVAVEGGVVGTVLWFGRRLGWPEVAAPPSPGLARWTRAAREGLRHPGAPALVALAFYSGFQVFGFEVLWMHLIGAVCGTSVYAFANMLFAVLLGLFVGGSVMARLFGARPTVPDAALPVVLLLGAGGLLAAFPLWCQAPLALLRWGGDAQGFYAGEALRVALCLPLVGLPAALLGLFYPLLLRHRSFPVAQGDAFAGLLTAANAVGSALGALGVSFLLLPRLGSEACYGLLLLLLVLVGATVAGVRLLELRRRGDGGAGALVLAACLLAAGALGWGLHARPPWDRLLLTSGINVYFRTGLVGPDSRLLFFHEDAYGGFTTVVGNAQPDGSVERVLLTNGKFQGSNTGERTAQAGFALLPALHAAGRERALVIGFGTGETARSFLDLGFEHVEVADIAPGILTAGGTWFSDLNRRALEAPNVEVYLEDGRNHLLRSRARYQVVSIELTSVWFAGSSNLYSTEFYELVREHLAQGGVLQQWIQLHHIAPEEVLSAAASLGEVFPCVSLWSIGGQGILVAAEHPLEIAPARQAELLDAARTSGAAPALIEALGWSPATFASYRLLDAADISRLAADPGRYGVVVNTDRNRWLEYTTPRHNLERHDHAALVQEALVAFRRAGR
jgi:spermidine synthase